MSETKTEQSEWGCESCAYWSQLIARTRPDCQLEAMCESILSPHRETYTLATDTCERWRKVWP